jgi:hypothetical protein
LSSLRFTQPKKHNNPTQQYRSLSGMLGMKEMNFSDRPMQKKILQVTIPDHHSQEEVVAISTISTVGNSENQAQSSSSSNGIGLQSASQPHIPPPIPSSSGEQKASNEDPNSTPNTAATTSGAPIKRPRGRPPLSSRNKGHPNFFTCAKL